MQRCGRKVSSSRLILKATSTCYNFLMQHVRMPFPRSQERGCVIPGVARDEVGIPDFELRRPYLIFRTLKISSWYVGIPTLFVPYLMHMLHALMVYDAYFANAIAHRIQLYSICCEKYWCNTPLNYRRFCCSPGVLWPRNYVLLVTALLVADSVPKFNTRIHICHCSVVASIVTLLRYHPREYVV